MSELWEVVARKTFGTEAEADYEVEWSVPACWKTEIHLLPWVLEIPLLPDDPPPCPTPAGEHGDEDCVSQCVTELLNGWRCRLVHKSCDSTCYVRVLLEEIQQVTASLEELVKQRDHYADVLMRLAEAEPCELPNGLRILECAVCHKKTPLNYHNIVHASGCPVGIGQEILRRRTPPPSPPLDEIAEVI